MFFDMLHIDYNFQGGKMKKLITLIVLFASTVVSAGTLVVNSNQSGESSKAAFDAYVDAVSYTHLTLPTICSV